MSDTSLKANIAYQIELSLKDKPEIMEIIKDIGRNISSTGMSIKDSCIFSDFNYDDLKDLMKNIPAIERYFDIHRIKYKNSLLKILHDSARLNQDAKLALQLLSLGFEDYDQVAKKEAIKKNKGNSADALKKLLKHVQSSAPNSPVNESKTIADEAKQAEKDVYDISHIVHAG